MTNGPQTIKTGFTTHSLPQVPVLLLVHGEAAVGKTTLAGRLADDLGLPFLGKDDISELLFDKIGTKYNAHSASSKKGIFSSIALRTLSVVVEEFAQARQSVILDAPFHSDMLQTALDHVGQRADVQIVQIFCFAEQATRQARYEARIRSGNRHPGHGDSLTHQIEPPSHPKLNVESTITVDLTEFGDDDYREFLDKLKQTMGGSNAASN